MKPQIIDRYVYVKGKKISEATSKSNLDGNEILPLAYNDINYNTTVDQISEYVDKVHDYLTTENYNDLKGQIDSERTNRQEADSELNQSIQDTKSELHSTISGVESELLGEVNDLQEQIDSINETGIAKGVTLDTAQTITGEKTFATVPKSTADATEDTDLVNKKYVDNIANASFVFTSEELNSGLPSNRLNECINAYNNNKIFYIQRDNGEKIPAKIKIDTVSNIIIVGYDDIDPEETGEGDELNIYSKFVAFYKSTGEIRNEQHVSFLFSKRYGSNAYLNGSGTYSRPTKETVGLGNVDNTSDLDKPVSNATKEYIDEQGFARTSDIPEGLEIGETTGTAFDGARGKAVEDNIKILPKTIVLGSDYSGNVFTVTPTQTAVNIHGVSKVVGEEDSITHNASSFVISSATTTKAGVMSAADKQKLDNIPTLTTSGDGTKYLSDNGTYKTIETPDLSNYLTEDDKTELETEIGDLSENVNGQITELQKKDSTIEGNVTNLTETVNTINDTVSGLDNIYLRKTGGTVNGDITMTGNLTTQGQITVTNGLTCGTSTYGAGTTTTKVTISDVSTPRLNDYYLRLSQAQLLDKKYGVISNTDLVTSPRINWQGLAIALNGKDRDVYFVSANAGIDISKSCNIHKLYHEGNIARSKVTTNDVSGGLNITKITQSAYDGLDSKSPNTLYIITE